MADITAHEVLFSHLCSSSKFPRIFALLACCRAVCRCWRNAVQMELPMLRVQDFSCYEARVVGADVLRALENMSGPTCASICASSIWAAATCSMARHGGDHACRARVLLQRANHHQRVGV